MTKTLNYLEPPESDVTRIGRDTEFTVMFGKTLYEGCRYIESERTNARLMDGENNIIEELYFAEDGEPHIWNSVESDNVVIITAGDTVTEKKLWRYEIDTLKTKSVGRLIGYGPGRVPITICVVADADISKVFRMLETVEVGLQHMELILQTDRYDVMVVNGNLYRNIELKDSYMIADCCGPQIHEDNLRVTLAYTDIIRFPNVSFIANDDIYISEGDQAYLGGVPVPEYSKSIISEIRSGLSRLFYKCIVKQEDAPDIVESLYSSLELFLNAGYDAPNGADTIFATPTHGGPLTATSLNNAKMIMNKANNPEE